MNKNLNIKTLGQLKQTGYVSRSVKDELRANLIPSYKIKKADLKAL
jgi:magnesium chelatase subunit I